MKTSALLFVAASAWSVSAFSQVSRPLQVSIGTGWALPTGHHAEPGPLFYLEPTYRLSNKFMAGIRTEYVLMQRGTTEPYAYPSPFDPSRRGGGSVTVSGQYFFSNGLVGSSNTRGVKTRSRLRPFIGAGAGVFSFAPFTDVLNQVADNGLGVSQHEVSGGAKFGCYPKVGVMAGHFIFSAQYNLVFGKSSELFTTFSSTNNGVQTWTVVNAVSNNYMSLRVGFVW